MSWNRREVLGGLGVASAQALLWAFGCSHPARPVRHALGEVSSEIRALLHEAVETLAGAGLTAHALAVSRLRSTAAIDVLGGGVAHARCDGVVLTVQQPKGTREQVTSALSRDGVMAAVRALATRSGTGRVDFGPAPRPARAPSPDPDTITDQALLDSVADIARRDTVQSSRIVYAAGMIDIDDSMLWSVAANRDLEQRLYRVRRSLTRVAWNGTRPIVSEVSRAWTGGINDQLFDDAEIAYAREVALALMTPTAFPDGEHALVLAPNVVAGVIDAAVRSLLTTTAALRPEVAQRLAVGATVASPVLTLVDDPTTAGAYGGFEFDDAGQLASTMPLLDKGHVVGRVARGRRPGHVGPIEPASSHLRLAPGTVKELPLDDGFWLEGTSQNAIVDPASDRVVIAVQRALEIKHGKRTGRVFADVEVVGDLGPLLASITHATTETQTVGIRDEVDGLPRWRSIEAPFLLGKGLVRSRRPR